MRLRTLLVVALSSGAIVSAQAADQSVPRATSYYPDAYHPTSIDWTGWYVGVQVGGAFGSANWTNPFSNLTDDPKPSAVLGGGQFGVNWTRDSLLLGAEADFAGMDLKGSANDANGNTHTVHSHWLSLVTGRVGYAFSRYLVYAKGGAAFANERNKVVSATGALADSGTTTQYGWTVGGGVEYAINTNWSARVEYDYVDLPSRNIVLSGTRLVSQPANVNFTIQKVVGGINYRF
jgi:outer membrane immunogenic protein